jgi:hypothetical protein
MTSMFDTLLDKEPHATRWAVTGPRKVPIKDRPPLEVQSEPSVAVGDLVVWNIAKNTNPRHYSPRMGRKASGIVLETHWAIMDYVEIKTPYYVPEATIMWSDGQLTNSHHSTLKRVTGRSSL